MISVVIRTATVNDVAEIREMIRELAAYERAVDQARATEEQLREALFGEHPAAFALIAEDDETGQAVGYAVWFPHFSTWTGTRGMHLEDLYVRPHARGGGHGKALLASLAATCRHHGYERFEWWVLAWNEPTIDFYKSLGVELLNEWTVCRLSGAPLGELAAQAPTVLNQTPARVMQPPVAAVIEAHQALERLVAGLNDQQIAEASALPGWSRGHVLAHLTDNARMFARLAEHALRGELVAGYDGGVDERNAITEATAGRSAAEHRVQLAAHTAGLEAAWARADDVDWSRPVTFRNADLTATVFARWREAWIHMVDLELDVRPNDWPEGLAAHAIDFLLGRLPAGTRVRTEDGGRQWSVGDGPPGTVVTGAVRDLAAGLAGRTPVVSPVAAQELPALEPWPSHPPQRLDRV